MSFTTAVPAYPAAGGGSQGLVAGVIAAARNELDLELEYRVDPGLARPEASVAIEAPDGRALGALVCTHDLDARERRAVRSLAHVLAQQLGRPASARERLRVQFAEVAHLLEARAIQVAFQPIVDLESGATVGVEALARFPAAPGVSPEVWFAEAEAAGLGRHLEWAAARAALARFGELPDGLFLSVNASPEVAGDRCMREMMRGLPHDRLVLEMTEHAPVEDYERLNRRLQPRREEGVRLAVDDAGAGFASLRHLLGIRPSIIKLDISLVRGIDGDPLRRSLAASLVAFARDAGADMLAEGVESEAELAAIRSLGIRFAQGFLLGRPELGGPLPDLAA